MKINKCIKCENTTRQPDGICVVCKLGISQMHTELISLLKKKKRWNVRHIH
jgi:hypothetical protein